jgi:hypothetical protein
VKNHEKKNVIYVRRAPMENPRHDESAMTSVMKSVIYGRSVMRNYARHAIYA